MSLLWRDEIVLCLAPRKLGLVRRSRGIRSRVVAATEATVPADAFGDAGPALARLADVLTEPTWHRAAARVIIADHWARYGVVPWPATRLDAAGRLTHARYVLSDTYGDAVADWAVTLADTPPGRPFVACATPPTLRTAIQETLAPARLDLVSIQPQLVVAFNACRDRLPADDTWFVSLDDGALSAVHLCNGLWDRVHMARLAANWVVELERLQAFGRLTRAAGGQGRMFVHAPAWMRRDVDASAGIEWIDLDDDTPSHALAVREGEAS